MVESLGLTERVIDTAVCALWSLYWVMILIALTLYAASTPDDFGVSPANFGQSFELMRACVLLTSLLAVTLLARALKLWDSQTVKDMLSDLQDARALKLAVYLMLGVQVFLYLVVALAEVQFGAVICLLGLNYLSTKSLQMLWAYVLLTLVSLPMDIVNLCTVPWSSMNLVWWAAYSSLICVVVLKAVLLGCMLVLHTKINFNLRFRGAAPQSKHSPNDDDDEDFDA